jgi:hypothetical protein
MMYLRLLLRAQVALRSRAASDAGLGGDSSATAIRNRIERQESKNGAKTNLSLQDYESAPDNVEFLQRNALDARRLRRRHGGAADDQNCKRDTDGILRHGVPLRILSGRSHAR